MSHDAALSFCSVVSHSTPSATTLNPKLWPRSIAALTMTASLSDVAIAEVKATSTFNSSIGRRRKYSIEE
jgi:hypothetical protein